MMMDVQQQAEQWLQQAQAALFSRFPEGFAPAILATSGVRVVYDEEASKCGIVGVAQADGKIYVVLPAFLFWAEEYRRHLANLGRKTEDHYVTGMAVLLAEEILHILLRHAQRGAYQIELGRPWLIVDVATHVEVFAVLERMGFILPPNVPTRESLGLPEDCITLEQVCEYLEGKMHDPLLQSAWEKVRSRALAVCNENAVGRREEEAENGGTKSAGINKESGKGRNDSIVSNLTSEEAQALKKFPLSPHLIFVGEGQAPPISLLVTEKVRALLSQPGLDAIGEQIFVRPHPEQLAYQLAGTLRRLMGVGRLRINPDRFQRKVYAATQLVFPATERERGDIGFVIDTSGSMMRRASRSTARLIDRALNLALSFHSEKVWIVTCDAQGYPPFRPRDYRGVVRGGGGTKLWEGVKTLFDRERYPYLPRLYEAVIIVSDGYSIWPEDREIREFVRAHPTTLWELVILHTSDSPRLPDAVLQHFRITYFCT